MMNRLSKQLTVMLGLMVTLVAVSPALGVVYFSDDFESYADDTAVTAAGWNIKQVYNAEPYEDLTIWTITNPGGRVNPPTANGTPSTGNFMISDSDQQSETGGQDTGNSHDLWTPGFATGDTVWFHTDVVAQLNDNGAAIFDVDVSTNGGFSWSNVFRRIAPGRANYATTLLPNNSNADAFYGRLDLDLTAVAANKSNVRVRLRHFEPKWDWYIAVDNVLVDDVAPPTAGPVEIFSEDFSGAKGLGSMLVDGIETGDRTWNTNDPGGRYVAGTVSQHGVNRLQHPAAAPTEFAIIDTDAFGQLVDDYLMTPVLNLSKYSGIVLEYESETRQQEFETRVLLMRDSDADGPDMNDEIVKIIMDYKGALHASNNDPCYAQELFQVPEADGQSNVFFAWHVSGENDWWSAVDNIRVTGVPEPSTIVLLACGALGLLLYWRRK